MLTTLFSVHRARLEVFVLRRGGAPCEAPDLMQYAFLRLLTAGSTGSATSEKFVEKVRDIVGLYGNPPEHALVLSVDENSQIQALDRTQPGLPVKRGRGAAMTHDRKAPRRPSPRSR